MAYTVILRNYITKIKMSEWSGLTLKEALNLKKKYGGGFHIVEIRKD